MHWKYSKLGEYDAKMKKVKEEQMSIYKEYVNKQVIHNF